MGYYLLSNRNPHGDHFYRSRRKNVSLIVMHCTAGLEDLDMKGIDHSAESTARYAATTSRSVSWHSGSDSDTCLELLPPGYTAWHCRGYNSGSYGHEISKKDMTWRDEPKDWVEATLLNAARHLGPMAKRLGIPLRRIAAPQADLAYERNDPNLGGFIGHKDLDPSRRSDPGDDFPWKRFFELCRTFTDPIKEFQVLFRIEGGRAVYVTNGSFKSVIPNKETFEAMGFQWADVRDISADHPLAKLRTV